MKIQNKPNDTDARASGGGEARNISFSENFAYVLND